jgi:hypothetical protein
MKKFMLSLSAIILLITGFAQQPVFLNQQEKDAVLYMREEEKLARDVYESLFTKWKVNPFGNIRQSEQTHMDRMKTLITFYKLNDPIAINNDKQGVFVNTLLQKYYNELVATGSQSLTEALQAGAKIEELDIKDLEERIGQTKTANIISTYNYLQMASGNHLRAFVRRLAMEGISYKPVILTTATFDAIVASENVSRRRGRGMQQQLK